MIKCDYCRYPYCCVCCPIFKQNLIEARCKPKVWTEEMKRKMYETSCASCFNDECERNDNVWADTCGEFRAKPKFSVGEEIINDSVNNNQCGKYTICDIKWRNDKFYIGWMYHMENAFFWAYEGTIKKIKPE